MKKLNAILILSLILMSQLVSNKTLFAHCEIPCGIYEDSLRASLISEHITTIEKSMKMIIKLSEEAKPDYNQLVRWVTNKEEHAKKIQELVSQYFLHQRVKITDPSDKEKFANYVALLSSLHEISVYSMKVKQSTDLGNIEKLKNSLETFKKAYFHSH